MKTTVLIIAAILITGATACTSGTTTPFDGQWHNLQEGSTMTLVTDASDRTQLTGMYHSKVGTLPSESFPILGRINGNTNAAAAWIVQYGDKYGSIAAWAGRLGDDCKTIDTQWHLTYSGHNDTDAWTSMLTGSDTFVRSG